MRTAPKDQVTKGCVGKECPPVPWRDHATLSREAADHVRCSRALQAYQGVSKYGGPDTTGCGVLQIVPYFWLSYAERVLFRSSQPVASDQK